VRRVLPVAVATAAAVVLAACTAGGAGEGGGRPAPVAGLGVTSNGEDGHSPRRVLDDARGALLATPGVHAVGSLDVAGRSLTVDLVLASDGSLSGLLSAGSARVQVVRDGGRVQVRGARELAVAMGVPAGAAAAAGDRYVAAAPGGPVDGLALPALADQLLRTEVDPVPGLGSGDVDGASAVIVRVGAGRVWVAATGRPWPLRLAGVPGVPGVLELSEHETPPSPATLPSTTPTSTTPTDLTPTDLTPTDLTPTDLTPTDLTPTSTTTTSTTQPP